MPITGKEAILKANLEAAIAAAVASECGSAPLTPNCIDGLSKGIADAIIPFLVANILVSTHVAGGTAQIT